MLQFALNEPFCQLASVSKASFGSTAPWWSLLSCWHFSDRSSFWSRSVKVLPRLRNKGLFPSLKYAAGIRFDEFLLKQVSVLPPRDVHFWTLENSKIVTLIKLCVISNIHHPVYQSFEFQAIYPRTGCCREEGDWNVAFDNRCRSAVLGFPLPTIW